MMRDLGVMILYWVTVLFAAAVLLSLLDGLV